MLIHYQKRETFGLDLFYNGSHSRVERGLEVSLVAVVDVETEMGYALVAEQTFDQGFCPDLTRMDYYLHHLEIAQPQLPPQIRYLAVDGAYAKEPFVTEVVTLNLNVISKLRRDANLRYDHLLDLLMMRYCVRRNYLSRLEPS
ncbi:hypothetical protein FM036_44315 [Nostoc sp. HG1]|nr:hypothetical protein [Nostoc sp. HG1]